MQKHGVLWTSQELCDCPSAIVVGNVNQGYLLSSGGGAVNWGILWETWGPTGRRPTCPGHASWNIGSSLSGERKLASPPIPLLVSPAHQGLGERILFHQVAQGPGCSTGVKRVWASFLLFYHSLLLSLNLIYFIP